VPPRLRSDPPDRLADSGAPTVPRPRAPEWEPGTALRVLRNDPTIRYADSGRQLLRMLDGPTAEWRELVDAVPSHCAGLVIEAVLDCIRAWHGVAEHLGKRPSTDFDDR